MHTRSMLFVAALLAAFCNPASRGQDAGGLPKYTTLDPEAFEKRLTQSKAEDVVVLDVRTPAEHRAGHLKGAVLIDYKGKDFDQKIKALDKSRTYLVYCASGYRSSSACKKLEALDFPHLYNLKGGITAWQKAGKPVQKEK